MSVTEPPPEGRTNPTNRYGDVHEPEGPSAKPPESGSIESSKRSRYNSRATTALIVILVIAIACLLVAPFYFAQRKLSPGHELTTVMASHDLVEHAVVMEQFDKVLRSGVIYPRWMPDINNGYGIAWTNFYPPGFYYLTSLIHLLIDDWLMTLFIASVLVLSASGLALYALSRAFYGRFASGVGALLYMLLPFHLIALYWQGAMPQFTGFLFLPLVLYFAFRLGSQPRGRHYAGLGLVYGAYVLTHLPVSYLMSYALIFYAVMWGISERDWRIPLRIACGMGIGLLLSAIYLLPALLESKYAYENVTGMFPYHSSYLLLLPPGDIFVNLLNHTFMLQALLLLVAVVILRSGRQFETASTTISDKQTRLWIILGIATTFMATSLAIYPSMLIPKLEVVAFPWRWIAVASVFTSLLAGAAAERLRRRDDFVRKKYWASCAVLVAIVMVNLWVAVRLGVIRPVSDLATRSTAGLLETNYTPRGATPPTALPDTAQVIFQPESANAVAEIIRWDPQYRKLAVRVDQPTELRLKTYNFPGWTARIDGQSAPISNDKDGVQVIVVPSGKHQIETAFVDTPPRKIGWALFSLGLILIAGLAVTDLREQHKAKGGAHAAQGLSGDEQIPKRLARLNTKVVLGSLVAFLIVLLGAVFVYRWRSSEGKSSSGDPSRTGAAAPDSTNRGSLNTNAEARLSAGSLTSIPVAIDENALSELMNALPMGKNDRVEELIQSGKLFRVPSGTRVRILEVGLGKVKVRVLEGESVTMDGWVSERWLK